MFCRFKSGVVVLLVVLWGVGAVAYAQQGNLVDKPSIRIIPQQPTEFEQITVVFEALFSSSCAPSISFSGPEIQSEKIVFKAEFESLTLTPGRAFSCSKNQTATGFRSNIGRLLKGEYRVVVRTDAFGEIEKPFIVEADENESTPRLTVEPSDPTEEDSVRVIYKVNYENNCTAKITDFQHRISEFNIRISVEAESHRESSLGEFVCENVETEIGFSIELGRLQRGEYTVTAMPGLFGGAKASFVVSPPPIPPLSEPQVQNESSEITIDFVQSESTDEWVLIRNRTDRSIDLTGWSLRADAKNRYKTYAFPKECVLLPKGVLRVHSGPGNLRRRDRDCFELIWNEGFIWPNNAGLATLIDPKGDVKSSFLYADVPQLTRNTGVSVVQSGNGAKPPVEDITVVNGTAVCEQKLNSFVGQRRIESEDQKELWQLHIYLEPDASGAVAGGLAKLTVFTLSQIPRFIPGPAKLYATFVIRGGLTLNSLVGIRTGKTVLQQFFEAVLLNSGKIDLYITQQPVALGPSFFQVRFDLVRIDVGGEGFSSGNETPLPYFDCRSLRTLDDFISLIR